MTELIRIMPIDERLGRSIPLPARATELAAGLDLAAANHSPMTLAPGERALVPCGFAMALPAGYEAQVRPRSGLAHKHGVTVLNAPGTIDADYRGEVKVLLINHGSEPFVIEAGMRIAQMVIARVEHLPIENVQKLPSSERGDNGFGSTGR